MVTKHKVVHDAFECDEPDCRLCRQFWIDELADMKVSDYWNWSKMIRNDK